MSVFEYYGKTIPDNTMIKITDRVTNLSYIGSVTDCRRYNYLDEDFTYYVVAIRTPDGEPSHCDFSVTANGIDGGKGEYIFELVETMTG
jgi:hypothetical protein